MRNLTWILIFVILIGGFLLLKGDEDTWLCEVSGWEKHGNPDAVKPDSLCINKIIYTEETNKQDIENYLKENISEISTTKEVLGGKFYITKINFTDSMSGNVEYEDGHIALKSNFVFERGDDGKLKLKTFENL
jgi:hypothetical protein